MNLHCSTNMTLLGLTNYRVDHVDRVGQENCHSHTTVKKLRY